MIKSFKVGLPVVRIVKMTFMEGNTEIFLQLFGEVRNHILLSRGCLKLDLFRDAGDINIFYTISEWESEEDLEAYRSSALFDETWKKVKALFAGKPEAWSLREEGGADQKVSPSS